MRMHKSEFSFINIAYAQIHTKVVIYKKQTRRENVHSSNETLTHAYAHSGGKWKLAAKMVR